MALYLRVMQNSYTKPRKGSKNTVMVVRNGMVYPQTLKKKTPVARAVAATAVPKLPAEARFPEGQLSLEALPHLS